jgi:hypothetical protein
MKSIKRLPIGGRFLMTDVPAGRNVDNAWEQEKPEATLREMPVNCVREASRISAARNSRYNQK